MGKIKLTISDIREKKRLLDSLTIKSDVKNDAADKLNYAIAKLQKRLDLAVKVSAREFENEVRMFNDIVQDIRVKYASVYPDDYPDKEKIGMLMYDDKRQFYFTSENMLSFNSEYRDVLEAFKDKEKAYLEEVVEIPGEPFLADENWPRVDTVSLFIKDELSDLLFKA